MADLYQHDSHKFADAGLQLRVPPDLVPPNQYSRLTNATPIIEGRLEGRAGLKFIVAAPSTGVAPSTGIHSLTRINQPSVAGVGDRLIGVDGKVFTFALPASNVAIQRVVNGELRIGDPFTFCTFHFASDSSAWLILADRAGMFKYKGGPGGGVYARLGLLSPAVQFGGGGAATAVDGGAGNLNNGSGPGYDWVYTYVSSVTQSESNPSATNFGGPSYANPPASGATPDPGFGGAAGTGFAGGTQGTLTGKSVNEQRQSGNYSGWPAGGPFQSLQLSQFINIANSGIGVGCAYSAAYFSLDAGNTWRLLNDSITFLPQGSSSNFITAILPITQDPTKVQVRYVVLGVGDIVDPQNVTARRIRDHGGDYSINDLLTGGGGTASTTLTTDVNLPRLIGVGLTQTVSTLSLTNRQATVTCSNPFDPQVDFIRLYRRGGSVTAGWAFVGQFAVTAHNGTTFTVTDNIADTNLGSFVNLTNDAPVSSIFIAGRSLPYIWGPCFNPARVMGCGDPDRPGSVYFSNPGNADQWASFNFIDCSSPSDPMLGGCVYNTRVFAFSKERMYEIIQGLLGGSTLQPFETPCRRGLISPWGLVSTARAVYFVAKDGIYSTDGGVEQSLVENNIKPLFPTLDVPVGRQVETFDAVNMERIEDIRLKFHNDELYFIYRGLNSGNLQILVYDQNKDRWRAASYPVPVVTVYSEEAGPASSLLLGDNTGSLYSTQSGTGDVLQNSTPDISVEIRTGAFDQGVPLNQKEYGNVIVDIDPGGATVAKPVTITPFLNGEVITGAAVTVTGTGRQQVPLSLSDVFGFNLSFGITFSKNAAINPVLFQFDILYRIEPVQVSHFETRELSYGMPGFGHARDAYIALRSTANATLTMTFDGVVQTYTIASTSNLRRKIYVPFNSNKGKLYRFSLDTVDGSGLRIYQEDCEVRFKPWITSLGYQVTRALGAEAPMVTQAFESQLLGGSR